MAYWKADDGTKIHYEWVSDDNRKPVLLLLPGLLGDMASQWGQFVPILRKTHQLLLVDLRGHALSENNSRQLLPEDMAADIMGLIASLKIRRLHIAGYSLGGYIGLMLALVQPQLVQSVLAHATKFYWTEDVVKHTQAQMDPYKIAEKAPNYANHLAETHGARNWRPLVRQAGDLVAYTHQYGMSDEEVGEIQCPVLLSVGDRDDLVTLVEASRLRRMLPKGALLVLPNVHHPFNSVTAIPLIPMMQAFHTG
jgi:pimeloyl-ACP methyl ester carboxylesterase